MRLFWWKPKTLEVKNQEWLRDYQKKVDKINADARKAMEKEEKRRRKEIQKALIQMQKEQGIGRRIKR